MPLQARLIALCLAALSLPAALLGQGKSATDVYDAIAASTKLDREGARPFHLKMETQLFDLKGKPSEAGMIEEWWFAPDQFRIEINSGDVHDVIVTGEPDQVSEGTFRSAFLLRHLLSIAINPLTPLNSNEKVSESDREIKGHKLSCLVITREEKTQSGRETTYCHEPGENNIRLSVSPDYTALRSSVGTFGSTNVALDVSISYMGHPAIAGKVTQLQVFDPAVAGSPDLRVSKVYNSDPHIPGEAVATGHIRSAPLIDSPLYARHEHIGGLVVLACRVTREGKVAAADVIATSNDLFDKAAVDGVKRWLYTPFTVKGQPVNTYILLRVVFYAG
jgi:TonB family protein